MKLHECVAELAKESARKHLSERHQLDSMNAYCVGWLSATVAQILEADPHNRESICANLLMDCARMQREASGHSS